MFTASSKLEFKPHQYQIDGINWMLSNPRSGLFLPPGLGKTSTVLMAFSILKYHGAIDKMLVIAPLRVCYTVWPNEIKKWSNFNHLSIGILHGTKKLNVLKTDHDIYVINPAGLRWLHSQIKQNSTLFTKNKWQLVVDEASAFKNSRSQRFKLLKNMSVIFDRRTLLTGTPAPNGLINIWSQIYLLDNGQRLGKYMASFLNKYFYPSGYMGYEHQLKQGAETEIYDAINDIVIHKSSDELDLPERIYNYIEVELADSVKQVYSAMKKELVADLGDSLAIAVNAAVAAGKLKQIANGGLYENDTGKICNLHDQKTDVVRDLFDELCGRPLLVIYEYNHDLDRLHAAFPSAPVINGGVVGDRLESIVSKWNNGVLPILFLHPQAGGHGLNLQSGGCHDVVWYSMPFDLELYEQANARVHRQGVKNAVTIHHIVAKGTIDEHVLTVLNQKGSTQQALLDYLRK